MRTEYIITAGAVAIVGVLLWNKDKIKLMKGLPTLSLNYLSPRTPPQYPSPTEEAGLHGYDDVPMSEKPMPVDNDLPSACNISTYDDWLGWLRATGFKSNDARKKDTWETVMVALKTRQGCFGNEGSSGGFAGGLSEGQPNQYTPAAFVPMST